MAMHVENGKPDAVHKCKRMYSHETIETEGHFKSDGELDYVD